MCNDQKMLKQQLKNSKKAKYEMGNFCEQYGYFSKDCKQKPSKLKNELNMLNINENDKEDIIRILVSRSSNSSSSSNDDILFLTDSDYHSNDETSDSLILKLVVETLVVILLMLYPKAAKLLINVLTKGEEQENLLINLISQIDNPELKEEYLKKLKKNMIKD